MSLFKFQRSCKGWNCRYRKPCDECQAKLNAPKKVECSGCLMGNVCKACRMAGDQIVRGSHGEMYNAPPFARTRADFLKTLVDQVNEGRKALKIIATDPLLKRQVQWDTGRMNINPPNETMLQLMPYAPVRTLLTSIDNAKYDVTVYPETVQIGCQEFGRAKLRNALYKLLYTSYNTAWLAKPERNFNGVPTRVDSRIVLFSFRGGIKYGTDTFTWEAAEALSKLLQESKDDER